MNDIYELLNVSMCCKYPCNNNIIKDFLPISAMIVFINLIFDMKFDIKMMVKLPRKAFVIMIK